MNNDLLAFAEFAKDNDHVGRVKVNGQSLSAREFEIFKAGARHGRAMMSPTAGHADFAEGVAELITAAAKLCKEYTGGEVDNLNRALAKIK